MEGEKCRRNHYRKCQNDSTSIGGLVWSGILDNLSHPSECEPDVSESRGPLLQTIPSVSVSGSMSLYWGCQGVSKTAKPLEILEKTAKPQKISAKTEKPHENLPKTAVRFKYPNLCVILTDK